MLKVRAYHGALLIGTYTLTVDDLDGIVGQTWARQGISYTILSYKPGYGNC